MNTKRFHPFAAGLLLLLLTLTGCGGAIESMSFSSPNGDRKVEVAGKRESPAGPIVVTVTLTVPKGTKAFTFEHQARSMTKETVSADWKNNDHCILSFKLDDGTTWEVEAFLLDDKVEAVKRFKIDGNPIY